MRVTCHYCGLPFQVRRVEEGRPAYCCTGCAVLARVPVDAAGNFPVNAHLVSALAVGFLYFNQLLMWGLTVLLTREGNADLALRFQWIGAGAAFAVWLSVLWVQRREGAARGKDHVFSLLVLSLLIAGATGPSHRAWLLAAANAAGLAWSFRGLLRKRAPRGAGDTTP